MLQHWETAHQLPGQPVADWCTHVRRSLLDAHEQDGTVISDAALTTKMLCATLVTCTKRTESCLRSMSGRYHENERKVGLDAMQTAGIIETNEISVVVVNPVKALEGVGRFGRGGKFA